MLSLILLLVLSCDAENYYGLPIGTIDSEQFGLFVNVFVANPHTIVIVGNKKIVGKNDFKDISLMVCQNSSSTLLQSPNPPSYTVNNRENRCSPLVQSDFALSQRWKRKVETSFDNLLGSSINSSSNFEEGFKNVLTNNTIENVVVKTDNNSLIESEKLVTDLSKLQDSYDLKSFVNKKATEFKSKKYKIKRRIKVRTSTATKKNSEYEGEKKLSTTHSSAETQKTHSSSVLISPIQEEIIVVLISDVLIQHYSWLGVWLQNLQKFYPLLSVENIEPPREENIGQFTKTSGLTASVVILNCNTILVQSIVVTENRFTKISFYVGIDDSHNRIDENLRCSVLGYSGPVDVETAEGSDLLILLPDGLRTFDIDSLNIYEHKEKNVIASIAIPNVLVPPCD